MKYAISLIAIAMSLLVPTQITEKAFAVSENAVVYQVQTGGAGTGTATQELVLIYNSSVFPVEVTDWCVEYSGKL